MLRNRRSSLSALWRRTLLWMMMGLGALTAPAPGQGSTVTIQSGDFTAVLHQSGVLVGSPGGMLEPGYGPFPVSGPLVRGFHGVQFEDSQGVQTAVLAGLADDWAQRDPVQRLGFESGPDWAAFQGQHGALRIDTRWSFDPSQPCLFVDSVFHNLGTDTLRNVLFTIEWFDQGPGATYPSDLEPMLPPAPPRLYRCAWMPDDLPPGRRTSLTFSYVPPFQLPRGRADDVPLVLWTSATWPNGLEISETNGVSWGDLDQDGWSDVFVAQGVELWRNLGGVDWSRHRNLRSQLDRREIRYGSAIGDYDNDGWNDFGTEPRSGSVDPWMHLFQNLTGISSFIDVSADPNIIDVRPFGDAETMNWADTDHDGNLDCFLPVYPAWAFGGPGNFFLHNLGPTGPGGAYRFQEKVVAAGLDNPPNSARPEGAEFQDADFDGDLELYSNGTLYQNHSSPGNPSFLPMTEAASGILFSQDLDEGCAFFDYDLDGDQDLIIAFCVGGHGVRLFEAEGDGSFFLAAKGIIDNPNSGLCLGFSKGDWDQDGDIDFSTKEVFRKNLWMEGQRQFVVATHSIPATHLTSATPAWADWDKDGDLDCFLGNWLSIGHFYENVTYGASTPFGERRFVRVRVVRDSPTVERGLETEYGATVGLILPGEEATRRRQLVSSAGGYLNQNEYTVHFALPPDPTPSDPLTDLVFDLQVDFNSDPAVGLHRVDRWVNPELGTIELVNLQDREIHVYRSGRAVLNGCSFAPASGANADLLTTTDGLIRPTDTTTPADPTLTPAGDWYVGLEFDTLRATGPLFLKEIMIDGEIHANAVTCGAATPELLLWDVSAAGSPVLVDQYDAARFRRNHRNYYRAETLLAPGRVYRLVGRVATLRGTPISAPVQNGDVTVTGGLSFQDFSPCTGVNVDAAFADPGLVHAAVRFGAGDEELWADLGQSLGGSLGSPVLTGVGALQAGTPVTLSLASALPSTPTFLAIGAAALCHPFAGGTLVPAPEHFLFPVTDASGGWTLSGAWPAGGLPGTTFYFQVLFPDGGAPQGIALSNAMAGTIPFADA